MKGCSFGGNVSLFTGGFGGGGIVSDLYGPWMGGKKNVDESNQDINRSVSLPSIVVCFCLVVVVVVVLFFVCFLERGFSCLYEMLVLFVICIFRPLC